MTLQDLSLNKETAPQPHLDRPVHHAEDLLGSSATASIVLGQQVYTLRRTRAGKLILTK